MCGVAVVAICGVFMGKEGLITAVELRGLLYYSPESGLFTWLIHAGGVLPGSVAGCCNSLGYVVLGLKGKKYKAHRLAWLYTYGLWPAATLDHLDADRSNNRMANLRCVSHSHNMQNIKIASVRSQTGVRGVYWSRRLCGYMASIKCEGKNKRQGPFKTIEAARVAYISLKRSHHHGYVPVVGGGGEVIGTSTPLRHGGNSTPDSKFVAGFSKHVNSASALNSLNRHLGVN